MYCAIVHVLRMYCACIVHVMCKYYIIGVVKTHAFTYFHHTYKFGPKRVQPDFGWGLSLMALLPISTIFIYEQMCVATN